MIEPVKAPYPWFGGKSRVAPLVWERFGDVPNYVEPFFGSGAVLLGRPTAPGTETVNDLDCVAPSTRLLREDMSWGPAGDVIVGDRLVAFDEANGPARQGLRAPTRYRRLAHATVTGVRRIVKPCYRLTFDDGTTVVASADHLWLGGSHKTGGRGWRWLKTSSMVCNRKAQRSWVLKVCDVVERENSFDAGWLGGMLDGEGHIHVGPALRIVMSQNDGPIQDRARALLEARGFSVTRGGGRRCKTLTLTGGKADQLAALMRFRPTRLIRKFLERCQEVSLYGRDHRAVGLVSKEFLGDQEVVAIQTDARTFIAEGLASHNCYVANFWRAVQAAPDAVAAHADWPVNEADLVARHDWLAGQEGFRNAIRTDPTYFDERIAGWWVWGACAWIGSGWCVPKEGGQPRQLPHLGNAGMGINRAKLPHLGNAGRGINRAKLPHLGNAGRGINRAKLPHLGDAGRGAAIKAYFNEIKARMRDVRVACGDWSRVLGESVTVRHGITGLFLDPPYSEGEHTVTYSAGTGDVATEVAAWCRENGDNPALRIALCGYEGEHAMPDTWACVPWKATGGYGSQGDGDGRANAHRERIWFSPACLVPGRSNYYDLFEEPVS